MVNESVSLIIQCPAISSAIATATALGTNERVTSWTCVIDWSSETANPTTSAVMRIGAASFAASSNACRPMSRTAVVSISRSSPPAT